MHSANSAQSLANSRILLVDDDQQVLDVLTSALADSGTETCCAADAAAARQAFHNFRPQVALIDQMLPGAHGTDLIREFAAARPTVLQFLATGAADDDLLKLALHAGAWSILSKPYRLSDLFEILDLSVLLNGAELLRSAVHGESPGNSPPTLTVAVHDLAHVGELAATLDFATRQAAEPALVRRIAETVIELAVAARAIISRDPLAEPTIALETAAPANGVRVTLRCAAARVDWRRELARSKSDVQVSRICGLYLAAQLASAVEVNPDESLSFLCAPLAEAAC